MAGSYKPNPDWSFSVSSRNKIERALVKEETIIITRPSGEK